MEYRLRDLEEQQVILLKKINHHEESINKIKENQVNNQQQIQDLDDKLTKSVDEIERVIKQIELKVVNIQNKPYFTAICLCMSVISLLILAYLL
jgi:predicted  nucleic acid-binding Zn-ribbon protein